MDYVPLYITLGLIFIIGVGIPLMVSDFVDTSETVPDSAISPLVDLVENGISIFTFNINIFGFLGDTLQNALVDYLTIFSYIPDLILIPLIIIMIVGIAYTFIKILPTT